MCIILWQMLIHVIKVVQYLFLFRLICHTLDLAAKHDIALIPAYIPPHLNVEASYLSMGRLVPEWQLIDWYFNFEVNQ